MTQSLVRTQPWPGPQGPHEPPPQSTSVSPPFCCESVHDAATHAPPAQAPLAQSAGFAQAFPAAQAEHGPPQSTSVSPPVFFPSWQEDSTHTFAAQAPLAQSTAAKQAFATAHAGHDEPPQSTSDSSPFLSPSVQVAGGERWQAERVRVRTRSVIETPPFVLSGVEAR
jgi:hypothetical protein